MEFEAPHKAASVTSITSEPPSLYSGSSVCDADSPAPQDPTPFEDFKFNTGLDTPMAIQIPSDEDDHTKAIVVSNGDAKGIPNFLHALKEEDKHVTVPVDTPTSSLERKRSVSVLSNDDEDDDCSQKRAKGRWLLTEEEKRANHIASEQKRRNTIRTGFKDMTDIIPTLKNVNNSKSTILFKAVDYIKHLDRRNRSLRDKVVGLQMRLEVKRRVSNHHPNQQHRRNTFAAPDPIHTEDGVTFANDGRRTSEMIPAIGLPSGAMAALLTHKNQQKQLEILQEQLRLQQELLTKHNIQHNHHHQRSMSFSSMAIPSSTPTSPNTASTLYSHLQEKHQQQQQQQQHHSWTYNSISIPSSSDEVSHQRRSSLNLLHHTSKQNLPQPQHPQQQQPHHHHPYHPPQHPSQFFHPPQHHSSVNISNSISTPALVVPANDDEHHLQRQRKSLPSPSHNSNAPPTTSSSVAFTIPADDDFRSA